MSNDHCEETILNSTQKVARIAGLLYLIFIVTGIFAGVVRDRFTVQKRVHYRPDLFRRLASSSWLSGFQIGILTSNPGDIVDP